MDFGFHAIVFHAKITNPDVVMLNTQETQFEKKVVMRGEEMSRIEAFVAAAFAFAVTMLIISLDSIPSSAEEFVLATKQIPAFAASFASIMSIWHAHALWCKRYGLEDITTIWLSGILIFIVLIYIYPLRMVMQSLFYFLSDGYFPFDVDFSSYWQVRFMFGFYAIGFLSLGVTFVLLYLHTLRLSRKLNLTEYEQFEARFYVIQWSGTVAVCLLAIILAISVPNDYVALSPFSFLLLFPMLFIVKFVREKQAKVQFYPSISKH